MDDNPEVVRICEANGLMALNRGPLAMGLLTGKYDAGVTVAENDVRGAKSPEWMKYFQGGKPTKELVEKVNSVKEILTSGGRSLAQGAVARLWARSENTVPIPGFRTVKQVTENTKALDFGPLSPEQYRKVNRFLER